MDSKLYALKALGCAVFACGRGGSGSSAELRADADLQVVGGQWVCGRCRQVAPLDALRRKYNSFMAALECIENAVRDFDAPLYRHNRDVAVAQGFSFKLPAKMADVSLADVARWRESISRRREKVEESLEHLNAPRGRVSPPVQMEPVQ